MNNKKPRLMVVTHTRNERPLLRAEMLKSLVGQLPDYAEHVFIDCMDYAHFEHARWESLQLAEFVCFVDDDDKVINDSIRKCMAEFDKNPSLGVVFTSQQMIDQQGNPLPDLPCMSESGTLTYRQVASSAQSIHHLAIIRSAAVDPRCLTVSQALGGIGIEWLIKATPAIRHGAVHVPIYGYQWRQYPDSRSKSEGWIKAYNAELSMLQSFLLNQIRGEEGDVPQAMLD